MEKSSSKRDISSLIEQRRKEFPMMETNLKLTNDEKDHTASASASALLSKPVVSKTPPMSTVSHQTQEEYDDALRPSKDLKHNILPKMDDIYLINYNLGLDARVDSIVDDAHGPEYVFKFTKFGNISQIELVSFFISSHHSLDRQPFIYVDIKEVAGSYYLKNGKRVFGKLISSWEKNGTIAFITEECMQKFSKPIYLDKLTFTFHDYQGSTINIKEIVLRQVKAEKNEKGEPESLLITCEHDHFLHPSDALDLQVTVGHETISHEVTILSIVDAKQIRINYVLTPKTVVSRKMRLFRTDIILAMTLKFSEINWFTLDDKSFETAQIVKLSNMVQDRNKAIWE